MLLKSLSLLRCQGPRWLACRGWYAAKQRSGWFRRELPCGQWETNPTGSLAPISLHQVNNNTQTLGSIEAVQDSDRILAGSLQWFSHHAIEGKFPPDWFLNPKGNGTPTSDMRHWTDIGDFADGDIKGIWEQARFGFVFPLVRAHAHSGDQRYVEAFWQAVENFRATNAPQCGFHWKCGQEIALRLMAWAFAILSFRSSPSVTPDREATLAHMMEVSARRIELNIGYALSQNNNHGVSEAAGLFTAGVMLGRQKWMEAGQELLDRLARELIYADGSFSQHSTNYHRLMLHDYLWCIRLGEAAGRPFSEATLGHVRRAGRWLLGMITPQSGRVPNLGANDGAHFLDLTDLGYRDYRPTVQAVGLAIDKRRWLPEGPWDELAAWLGLTLEQTDSCERVQASVEPLIESPVESPVESCVESSIESSTARGVASDVKRCPPSRKIPSSALSSEDAGGEFSPNLKAFRDGGYVVWRDDLTLAVLRCAPRFRHRPSQSDLLHFDLWVRGRNLLRDAGTYSYNCDEPWLGYFSSSRAHNTIRFDSRDSMPKLSRFLYGAWPQGELEVEGSQATSRYRDYCGAKHSRTVVSSAEGFRVEDQIGGPFRTAVLQWRLDPDLEWTMTEYGCRSSELELIVSTDSPSAVVGRKIATGWESQYYWQKNELPVLEIEVNAECRKLVTEIRLNR